MEIQLNMLGVIVSDMPAALRFYRLLGLDIPAKEDEKPFVLHRMGSGVTLFFDTVFAKRYDPHYAAPSAGYGTLLEFYLGEDSAVDAKYGQLTDAGYHGRMTPQHTNRTLRRNGRRSRRQRHTPDLGQRARDRHERHIVGHLHRRECTVKDR